MNNQSSSVGEYRRSDACPDPVPTISSEPSVSLHLLANDIGCVVRQKFDPESRRTEPFRSGWSNAPCEDR
jgi:hypothetical protein